MMIYAVVIGVYTLIINILNRKINSQMKLLNYLDLVEVRPPGLAACEERFPACANSLPRTFAGVFSERFATIQGLHETF